jgi:hypothetical protein
VPPVPVVLAALPGEPLVLDVEELDVPLVSSEQPIAIAVTTMAPALPKRIGARSHVRRITCVVLSIRLRLLPFVTS